MAAQNKHGLGRGLEALFGDDDFDLNLDLNTSGISVKSGVQDIPVSKLTAGKYQPRQNFDNEALEALAESVKEKGVLQPILVRKLATGYEIIAGERRFRAAQKAGLTKVPVIIKEMDDNEVLEVALIENIVRQDLTAIEEALGFEQLMQQFSYTQEKLSKVVGKSRSYIANSLRLLSLPQDVQDLVNNGKLTSGHARTLVGNENASSIANQIISEGLNVRQAENLASALKQEAPLNTIKKEKKVKDVELQTIEKDLTQKIGLKVQINAGKNGKGKIILNYNDISQLENIINKLEQ